MFTYNFREYITQYWWLCKVKRFPLIIMHKDTKIIDHTAHVKNKYQYLFTLVLFVKMASNIIKLLVPIGKVTVKKNALERSWVSQFFKVLCFTPQCNVWQSVYTTICFYAINFWHYPYCVYIRLHGPIFLTQHVQDHHTTLIMNEFCQKGIPLHKHSTILNIVND